MVGVGVEITIGFGATSLSLSGGEQGLEAGLSGGDESTSTGSSSLILMSGVEGRDMSRGPAVAFFSSSSAAFLNSCSKELASSLKSPTSSQFFRNLVGVGV